MCTESPSATIGSWNALSRASSTTGHRPARRRSEHGLSRASNLWARFCSMSCRRDFAKSGITAGWRPTRRRLGTESSGSSGSGWAGSTGWPAESLRSGTCPCAVPRVFPVRWSIASVGDHGRLRSRGGWQSPGSSAGTGQSRHRIPGQRIAPMTRLRHDRIRIFQTRRQPCPFPVRAESDFGQFSRECRPIGTGISRRNDHRKAVSSPLVELGGHSASVSGRATRPSCGSISHRDRAFRERLRRPLSRKVRLSRQLGLPEQRP